jgi:hypothetical protein
MLDDNDFLRAGARSLAAPFEFPFFITTCCGSIFVGLQVPSRCVKCGASPTAREVRSLAELDARILEMFPRVQV